MKKDLERFKIKDLFLSAPKGDNAFLEASGSVQAIRALKKRLTFVNKSSGYRIKQLTDDLRQLAGDNPYTASRRDWIKQEIKKLKEESVQEYFFEDDDRLFIPAGYWYFGEEVAGDHHLGDIKPVLMDGNRPYQSESVEALLTYKRATLVLATGLGKTWVIANVCMSAIAAGKRVCIIVPTEYLVGQVCETIKKFTDSVTGASSKRTPKLGTDVMVCTVGTAAKHIDKFQVVMLDESHHSPANTWADLLASCKTVEYVYNLTATPFRTDGMDLAIHAFGGPTVYEKDVYWGIQNKWLSPFDVYIVYCDTHDNVPSKKRTATAYKRLLNDYFLEIADFHLKRAISSDRRVIALFKTLVKARELGKRSKTKVADANFKKPLRDFQDGKTKTLIATDRLVSEGIDIPDADVLMLALQNSSEIITMQALGRVLRLSDDKKKPIVIDLVAKGYGPFMGSSKKRKKIWESLADNVTELGYPA